MNTTSTTNSSLETQEQHKEKQGIFQYHNRRYVVFGIMTFIALVLPFITINGNHIFLLSFDNMQLHLLGVAFDMQELYLMPFLVMILFLSIFFMTNLAGRVWCGWSCPQTIFRIVFRDLIETKILKLRKTTNNRQVEPDMSLWSNKLKELLAIVIWGILAFIAACDFLWYFVPPNDFFAYLRNPQDHYILIGFLSVITLFLIADIVFIKENFCIYICPYCRIQSVLYDNDTIMTVYDYKRGGAVYTPEGQKMWKKPKVENAQCTGCEACVRVCPTHIDIRKGMQLECINCLECSDACAKVMAKFNLPSLIGWTSSQSVENRKKVNYFRFSTVAYIVVLTVVFCLLLFMSGTKESMLLNINRQGGLYTVRENMIENSYIFLFHNTDTKPHTYYFEVVNNADISIKRPKNPFVIKPDQKVKQVVILQSSKDISTNTSGDTNIPITIRAFAIDSTPEKKIEVLRKSIFIAPPKQP